jgi:hypothetical protein
MSSKTTVEVALVDVLDKMESRLQAAQLALENRLQANQHMAQVAMQNKMLQITIFNLVIADSGI